MPRVTANQVTVLRLVLLPLPMAMLYQEGVLWALGALAAYTVLGLTDVLDGMLARRHGSTPLGALLDPVVDKIFLAAAYGPLADRGIVSMGLVSVIFVRELLVTGLRSVAFEEAFAFRTSRVAKLKTTVQMGGAGFILLIWLFPRQGAILPMLGVAALGSLVPGAVALLERRTPGFRAKCGAILVVPIFLLRLVLDRGPTIWLISLVIVGFTLASGADYVWSMRWILASRLADSPIEGLRLVGLSVAVPVVLLPAMALPGAAAWIILAVLAGEIAVGGLDNWLARAGRRRSPGADLLRSAAQAAAGGVLLSLLPDVRSPSIGLAAWSALLVTLADLEVRILRNLDVLRTASRIEAQRLRPPGDQVSHEARD